MGKFAFANRKLDLMAASE